MDHLKDIVELETMNIRKKLNLVLSLNENLYVIGYIMEVNLVEIIALYTPYELEELYTFFVEQYLGKIKGMGTSFPFKSFPNIYLDIKKGFYSSYCKWLYRLERIFHFDEKVIPVSFKKFLFKDNKLEEKLKERDEIKEEEEEDDDDEEEEEEEDIENEKEGEMKKEKEKGKEDKNEIKEDVKTKRRRIKYEMNIDTKDSGLKNIMLGEKKEFYQTIIRIMEAPEAGNANDLTNLETFIEYEKDHLKYIPLNIQNKENLANIVNILLNHYSYETLPEDIIVPLFKNVNDVLRLALVLSDHSASDLGKPQQFKSFSNPERRLFMKLLNNCSGDRYDDFLKYHNIWSRFFEKIHPLKYKTLYPDLIEDLLGTYRFIGEPKNRQLRMEYTFYQILLKLNECLVKYREDTIKLIQHKTPITERQRNFEDLYNFNTSIENPELLFNLEFLDKDDPNDNKNPDINYENIPKCNVKSVRSYIKNIRINTVLSERDLPLNKEEHEKILEKFKNLKMLPEKMKKYLYSYLQNLVPIFTDSLEDLISTYTNNWEKENYEFNNVSLDYFNEYILAMKRNSISLCNRIIPTLDTDLIQNRINEISPLIVQLSEQAHTYRKERQPFNSKWVELISKKKIEEAAQLLTRKPGVFLRQLDELITKSENESQSDLILQLFEEVASKTSIKVLLSMKGYFQKRMEPLKGRAFLVQGGLKDKKSNKNNRGRIVNLKQGVVTQTHAVIYYTTKVKKPLDEVMCQKIVRICDEALIRNFQTKSKLSRVYISPDIEKLLIPDDLRSEKKVNGKMYSKGSRISIKFKNITEEQREKIIEDLERKLEKNQKKVNKYIEKKGKFEIKYVNQEIGVNSDNIKNKLAHMEKKLDTLKSFVEKNKEELERMKNYNVDSIYKYIRLYVVNSCRFTLELYDENLQLKLIYPTLKDYDSAYPNPFYRGSSRRYNNNDDNKNNDIKGNEDLFCYFRKWGYNFYDIDLEKIVQNGIRYIVIHIESGHGSEIQFGWMERRALNSSEPFDPAHYNQNITFNNEKDACPLILDCKTREFIWIDKELDYSYYNDFRNICQHLENMDKDQSVELSRFTSKTDREKYLKRIEKCKKSFDRNLKTKNSLFYYYLNPLKISIGELIKLHIQARDGIQVESEKELKEDDLAFLAEPPLFRKDYIHYIFYHQHDTLLANYMS